MGKLATAVQTDLAARLEEMRPGLTWQTEHDISGTPVDIAGRSEDELILVELEWRRADPADNSAKLFRHLSTGGISQRRVVAVQVFTEYYDLARGGVSSKRKNAEFVGRMAADLIDQLSYHPVDFDLDPPKRGEDCPDDWDRASKRTADRIQKRVTAALE